MTRHQSRRHLPPSTEIERETREGSVEKRSAAEFNAEATKSRTAIVNEVNEVEEDRCACDWAFWVSFENSELIRGLNLVWLIGELRRSRRYLRWRSLPSSSLFFSSTQSTSRFVEISHNSPQPPNLRDNHRSFPDIVLTRHQSRLRLPPSIEIERETREGSVEKRSAAEFNAEATKSRTAIVNEVNEVEEDRCAVIGRFGFRSKTVN
ncbi:hypothetical protein Droror1_Dr00024632 [Drosera rotundifolia]